LFFHNEVQLKISRLPIYFFMPDITHDQPKKPTYPHGKWRPYNFKRMLFPPFLIWDISKLTINFLFGWLLGFLLLPAQNKMKKARVVPTSDGCIFERTDVRTDDKASLDTLDITPSNLQHSDPKQLMHVINFMGQAGRFDAYQPELNEYVHVKELSEYAKNCQCKMICFNYRGVGGSSKNDRRACSKDDLLKDGIAQVRRLLEQGIPPANIVLKGYSLGGAVATLVASHFHNLDIRLHLFNDRSFSSLTNVLVGRIRTLGTGTGHQEYTVMKILGWLIKPAIKLILLLVNWEIDADTAFKSLPEHYKDYIVVRSDKKRRQGASADPEQHGLPKDDTIIPHYASLHAALKEQRREKKRELDKKIADSTDEATTILLLEKKALFKARKMVTEHFTDEGHEVPLNHLENRDKNTAQTFFSRYLMQRRQASSEESLDIVSTASNQLTILMG
jgi:pimeloyl-ACP methyl ester carboxylesterase